MIAPQTCEKIREMLLANQQSLRSIARQMGVSPATVIRISRRRHWRSKPVIEQLLMTPVRCPGCGGRIDVLPCRLCRARQYLKKRRAEQQALHQYVTSR